MITRKDLEVISHLRRNARKKITDISAEMGIPATTVYDKVNAHLRKGIVKGHVALLDFSKLGFMTNAVIVLKVKKNFRQKVHNHLSEHLNINSLFRINNGHDYLAEVIFQEPVGLRDFVEDLEENYGVYNSMVFNIIQEAGREKFFSTIPSEGKTIL